MKSVIVGFIVCTLAGPMIAPAQSTYEPDYIRSLAGVADNAINVDSPGVLAKVCPGLARTSQPRQLSLVDRAAYQKAIEEVYWRHRIWPRERPDPKPVFDKVMPLAKLEQKVLEYLRNSQSLEDDWQQPIGPEQLQAEMDRMAQHTGQPEVLREIFAALKNDPFVIAECLARPILSERLMKTLSKPNQGRQESSESPRTKPKNQTPKIMAGAIANYQLPTIPDRVNTISGYSGTATGTTMAATRAPGCSDDTWSATSITDSPIAGASHTAVWTGSEMIVWGGSDGQGLYFNTGGRYSPATDSWTGTTTTNAPEERILHKAVWTGSEMIVWGGVFFDALDTGGKYNPVTDSWTATSLDGAPSGRYEHALVWTGNEMIVWGGEAGGPFPSSNGGKYNPGTDSWTEISTANAPMNRGFASVWTGSEMIVWGGQELGVFPGTGKRYNPVTDSWTTTSTAPTGRYRHTLVWSGTEMIMWGGRDGSDNLLNTGGRYSPGTDSWVAINTTNAPGAREFHTAVWTGSEMIVWGGSIGFNINSNTGGRYNPRTDSWALTSTADVPSPRVLHTAVWAGSEMIVWGGTNSGISQNTGAKYCSPSAIMVSLPTVALDNAAPIDTVFIEPVITTNLDTSLGYIGFQGDFTFNETVVTFSDPFVEAAGLTGTNWNVLANILPGPGPIRTLRLSALVSDGITALNGSGTLYNLRMRRVGSKPGTSTALTWLPQPDHFVFIDTSLNHVAPGQISGLVSIFGTGPTPTPTPTLPPTPTPTPDPTPIPSDGAGALNISTRLQVQGGDNVGIAGFIITGTAPKQVLLRGIGPSLLGVHNALVDPVMELNGGGGFVTITNDNWRDNQQAAIEATGIPPSNYLESAILATLPPGSYTAILRGQNEGSGVALVEVYDLSQAVASKLGNIATRAFVNTGNDIVIAGFILGNGASDYKIAIRGIGPSLTAFGVPNTLTNPTLELRDISGAVLASNNDWQDDSAQAAELTKLNLAPTNILESGIVSTLLPGAYTALLAGVENGTGNALVEVYVNPVGGSVGTPTPTPGESPTPTATPGGSATPSPTPVVTPTPTPATCVESFDGVTAPALPSGWVASNPVPGDGVVWVTSTIDPDTPPNDAFLPDQDGLSDKVLDRTGITIKASTAILTFRNNFDTECDGVLCDGGMVEVSAPSISNGEFLDITDPLVGGKCLTGCYNQTINGGRMGWGGNSGGYIDTVFNLGPNLSGQTITLRWRFISDEAVSAPGWRIDTLSITEASCP